MVHSQPGKYDDLWDHMAMKLEHMADGFQTFRKLVDCDFDPELMGEGLTDEQKAQVAQKMSLASYTTELEDEARALRVKCKTLEERVGAEKTLADERHLESCRWKTAYEGERRRAEDLEKTLERTITRGKFFHSPVTQSKVKMLVAGNEAHNQRLALFFKHNTNAILCGSVLTMWRKQASIDKLQKALEASRQQLAEERIRYTAIIDGLKDELELERAEINRLVHRSKELGERRCLVAKAWINPSCCQRYMGVVFDAWRNSHHTVKDAKSNWFNVRSLRWYMRQLAWMETFIDKLDGDTMASMAEASATQFSLEMERHRRRETQATALAESDEFRHMRAVAREKFKAEIVAQEKRIRDLLNTEIRALNKEKDQLVLRVEDLEDTMYDDEMADKFPVCRASLGTRCVECSRRIVYQEPNNANMQAIVRLKSRDTAVDNFVHKIMGPYQASIFAKPVYGRRRA